MVAIIWNDRQNQQEDSIVWIINIISGMANYLKYTLSKEETAPSKNKVPTSKTYKTANMYVTSNKT